MKKIIFWTVLALVAANLLSCSSSPRPTSDKIPANTQGETPLSPMDATLYQKSLTQLNDDEIESATKSLAKLTVKYPSHSGLVINYATALYKSKDFNAASEAVEKLRKTNPNIAEVYNLSGLLAVEKAEYKEAENHYLKALKLNDNYADAHYNLALLYDIFYQNLAKAIFHYEQYLAQSTEGDKNTLSWVEELKSSLKRRGGG